MLHPTDKLYVRRVNLESPLTLNIKTDKSYHMKRISLRGSCLSSCNKRHYDMSVCHTIEVGLTSRFYNNYINRYYVQDLRYDYTFQIFVQNMDEIFATGR